MRAQRAHTRGGAACQVCTRVAVGAAAAPHRTARARYALLRNTPLVIVQISILC